MPPPPAAPAVPAAAPSAPPGFRAVTPADLASLRGQFSPTLHLLPLSPPLVREVARIVNACYRLKRGWANEADLVCGQRVTAPDLQRELKTAGDAGRPPGGVYVVVDHADEPQPQDAPGDEAEHALSARGGRATVLGCVELRVVRRTPVGEVPGGRAAGYVGMLTVCHEWQGRGLGRWLLRWSERCCRRNGLDRMLMCVLEPRQEIIRWYQRCGFRKTTHKVDARPFIEAKGEQLLVDCCFVLLEKVFLQHPDETAPVSTAPTAQRAQIQVNSTT